LGIGEIYKSEARPILKLAEIRNNFE